MAEAKPGRHGAACNLVTVLALGKAGKVKVLACGVVMRWGGRAKTLASPIADPASSFYPVAFAGVGMAGGIEASVAYGERLAADRAGLMGSASRLYTIRHSSERWNPVPTSR